MGILKPRGFFKKENTLLQNAEEVLTNQLSESYDVDLSRIGLMWSGLLGLDTPIAASEVAAMLSCVDLIRATTLVDSLEHWTSAAAHAALGYEVEPNEDENEEKDTRKMSEKNPIGFVVQDTSKALSTE